MVVGLNTQQVFSNKNIVILFDSKMGPSLITYSNLLSSNEQQILDTLLYKSLDNSFEYKHRELF